MLNTLKRTLYVLLELDNMKYSKNKLSNGSNLVYIYLPYSQSVIVSAYIKAGFRSDPNDKPGIAHFTEHMLFTGSKKFPSHHALATEIEKFGGWHYAYTWFEHQQHEVCLPFQKAREGIEILLDTIFSSLIRKTEVEKEKGVIKKEIMRYKSDIERLIFYYVWFPLFFQGTKLSRPCIGTEAQIDTYTNKDIEGFIKSNFISSNIVFFIAGNISKSRAIDTFEKYIQKNKTSENVNVTSNISLQKNHRVFVLPYRSKQVAITIGIQTVSMSRPERHIFTLIENMLSRDFGASIPTKLRDYGGLVYNLSSSQENLLDSGYMVFMTLTDRKNVMTVLKVILNEFDRIGKGNFSNSEVEVAKSNLIGSLQIGLETNYALLHWYGYQELLRPNHIVHPQEITKIYHKISKNDIVGLAKNYFAKDKVYIGLLGDAKQQEIETLLE